MWIESDNARLYAELLGESPPSIVMIHGLGGSRLSWGTIGEKLAQRRRVAAVDLRGCGLSETGNGRYDIALLADDIVRAIDALGEDRVHLLGHSLGGVVCQDLLCRHNDRCLSAALISTSSRVGEQARRNWLRLAQLVEQHGLSRSETGASRSFSAEFARANPDLVKAQATLAARSDPIVYAQQARAASNYDYTEALGGVQQPVLVVQGLADRLTSPGGSVLLDRALMNSRLEMVEGVGHNAHIEMGDGFVDMVSSFFDSVATPPRRA